MVPRARSALTLVCLLACGWYVVFVARAAFRIHDGRWVYSLFDDAMISMRYARNLADGYGLRWNPGEPAVEGYSNLLWTLVMAGLHLLRLPDRWAALPVAITGIAILAGSIWMAARIADALVEERGSRAGVYAAVLTATCYPVVFWTLRGMEVGLLALFTLLLVRATIDRGMRVSRRCAVAVLATAGLVLARDDGIVLVIAVCAAGVFAADRETRRVVSASVTALAVSTAAHLLWRRSYYGGWVPNTYYLKLTGAPLADRLSRGASTLFGVVTRQAGPILIVAACELWRRFETRALILIAPFAATCAYSLYVGGDAWEFLNFANRYVSPSLPALCVAAGVYLARLDADAVVPRAGAIALAVMMLAGAAWDAVEKVRLPYFTPTLLVWAVVTTAAAAAVLFAALRQPRRPRGAGWMALVFLVALSEGRPLAQWALSNFQMSGNDREETQAGFAVLESTSPPASIAVTHAGSGPYFARRRSIDLLGKSDRHIAMLPSGGFYPGHDKMDLPYSFGMRPDVVVTLYETTGDVRIALEQWGYDRLCVSYWIRRDTTLVDRAALRTWCR
jgi:hypothetical protein